MDFDFDTGRIYEGLATLDVSVFPPLSGGGPSYGVLTITGTGALTLPQGTPAQRPAAAGGTDVAGMFRYNTSVNQLEYFDSTTWQQLTSTAGTVSSFQTSLSGLTPSTATTGAVTLAGTLGATSGGTGSSSAPTAGQFLYSSAGTTYTPTTLSGIAVTTFAGGTTGLTPAAPTSGAITLAGTLVLANGGTSASLTAVAGAPVYSTVSAMAFGTAGTSGDAYISGGAGAPTWQTVSSTLTTGQILEGDGAGAFTANGATYVGSPTFSGVTLQGTVTNATDATTKEYVDNLAAGLSWKQAVKAGTVVQGVLATSYENGDIIDGYTLVTGNRILIKSFGTGILAFGAITPGSGYAPDAVYTNVPLTGGTGSSATADITVSGGVVTSVVLVSQGSGYTTGDSLSANDADLGGGGGAGFAVLVDTLQNTQNGIYTVNASGAPTRSTDMDATTPLNEVNGAAVFVENGSTLADTAWVQTATVTKIGDDPIVWAQFAGAGSYTAGNGLQLLGNQFSLVAPVSIANGGTALTTAPSNGQLLIGNGTGYTQALPTAGTAISITPGAGSLTITNTGVTSAIAGTGISVSSATGDVTISNTGVTSWSAGTTGLLPSSATTGAVTLSGTLIVGNGGTGVTSLTTNGVLYGGSTVGATAEGATGQILVGTTGSPPSWTTPSGVLVTSFQTSLSGLTPATATTGAVTLAGTLGFASGGTGLTALGAANTVLGVNAAGTALEYKTVTAGTAISVVHTAGVITINNTGVTAYSLNDSSTTPIYTTSPTASSTGSIAATITLNTQTANTVFSGPASGGAAQPTFRTLVYADVVGTGKALQLYAENPSTPTVPTTTGANAVAIGSGASATAVGSFAEGDGALARLYGQKAYANGKFAAAGDAQHGVYVLRVDYSTSATFFEMFLDGTGGSERLVLPDNSVFTFDILIAGARTDGTSQGAGYRFVGVAKKLGTGTIAFIGTPSKTVIGETVAQWDARITADTGTDAIIIETRGPNSGTVPINWVATVQTTEVTF